MEIYTRPIMNVGADNNGEIGLFPFSQVNIIDKHNLKKTVYTNWTHGAANKKRDIKFESELGQLKHALFKSLHTDNVMIVRVFQSGNIKQRILDMLEEAEHGQIILFVWPKSLSDEKPYYEVLNMMINGKIVQPEPKPIALSDTGMTIKPPFIEIPLSEITG